VLGTGQNVEHIFMRLNGDGRALPCSPRCTWTGDECFVATRLWSNTLTRRSRPFQATLRCRTGEPFTTGVSGAPDKTRRRAVTGRLRRPCVISCATSAYRCSAEREVGRWIPVRASGARALSRPRELHRRNPVPGHATRGAARRSSQHSLSGSHSCDRQRWRRESARCLGCD
jgi:hypothetical protein